jgi:predicted metalloprotease with PDZ domain
MTDLLWFAEGFTSYYDDLVLVRAGLLEAGDYADRLGRTLDAVINAPGRRVRSPVEMSMQAPFVDAAVSVDPTNRPNTFLSYYTWGSAVALGLDLTLRTEFRGLTLDDYMRTVWERFGRTEVPYSVADLERVLADLTEDEGFAREFFRRYVRGREVPNVAGLLQAAGLILRPAHPDRAHLGRVSLSYGEEGATLRGPTRAGSPLHEAGLDRGDRITTIAGRTPGREDVVDEVRADRAPGDRVELRVEGRGRSRTGAVTLAEDPTLEVVSVEEAGRAATPAMERFRSAWLGSRVAEGR